MNYKGDAQFEVTSTSDYLSPPEAAKHLGLSASLLAKLRMQPNRHRGPAYSKFGKSVRYHREDLAEWRAANRVTA
jgi:Helix-turn-helix domain